jgi:lysozyme
VYSPALLPFVKAREGCKLTAYWDSYGNVWTIGYGCTGPDIVEGLVWTQDQADAALVAKLDQANAQLLAISPGPYIDAAEDALTDFVYNEGSGHYRGSTLRTRVDAQDWASVKSELLKWEFANGKKLAGLVNRREGEAAMV